MPGERAPPSGDTSIVVASRGTLKSPEPIWRTPQAPPDNTQHFRDSAPSDATSSILHLPGQPAPGFQPKPLLDADGQPIQNAAATAGQPPQPGLILPSGPRNLKTGPPVGIGTGPEPGAGAAAPSPPAAGPPSALPPPHAGTQALEQAMRTPEGQTFLARLLGLAGVGPKGHAAPPAPAGQNSPLWRRIASGIVLVAALFTPAKALSQVPDVIEAFRQPPPAVEVVEEAPFSRPIFDLGIKGPSVASRAALPGTVDVPGPAPSGLGLQAPSVPSPGDIGTPPAAPTATPSHILIEQPPITVITPPPQETTGPAPTISTRPLAPEATPTPSTPLLAAGPRTSLSVAPAGQPTPVPSPLTLPPAVTPPSAEGPPACS